MYTQQKVSCFHVRTATYTENSNTVEPPLSGHRLFSGQLSKLLNNFRKELEIKLLLSGPPLNIVITSIKRWCSLCFGLILKMWWRKIQSDCDRTTDYGPILIPLPSRVCFKIKWCFVIPLRNVLIYDEPLLSSQPLLSSLLAVPRASSSKIFIATNTTRKKTCLSTRTLWCNHVFTSLPLD